VYCMCTNLPNLDLIVYPILYYYYYPDNSFSKKIEYIGTLGITAASSSVF